ncbi:MAG: hypothetical protein U0903_05575 [Planctomycetales bacterium]
MLQPLGKEKALDAIEEFAYRFEKKNEIEVGDAVNFVMRVLFDVPADPGYFPEMGYWFFRVAPALNKRFPRYPIILIEDIPIRVSLPVGHSGSPPDPAELVPYFRKHGVVRAKPLTPTNKPFAALDEYAKSSRWYQDPDEKRDEIVLQVLQRQIFSLLETVYQVEEGDGDPPQFDDLKDPDVRLTEASKLQIRWDAKANQYTFLDGKSLPDPDPNRYRRKIWKIPESGEDAALIFERKGRHSLSIMTENSGVEIRIFNIKAKDKTLCDPTLFTSGGAFWTGIRFDDGEELQAEVTVGDKKYLSPVFKP